MAEASPPPYTIDDLLRVMERLRDPETGCPWDLQQDFVSIAPHTLEEIYELIDALERNDLPHVADELGDVLFQVVFYSQLGRERQAFDFSEVVDGITRKLLRRHPHVFADGAIEGVVTSSESVADIKARWESIKATEREQRSQHGALSDVPLTLPALSRAQKIQKRAASVGFDWEEVDSVIACLEQELNEFKAARAADNAEEAAAELGDVLFSAVNVARHLGRDAEQILRHATHRFEARFQSMERAADIEDSALASESRERLEQRWQVAKRELSNL